MPTKVIARPVVEWIGDSRPATEIDGYVPVGLLTDEEIRTLVDGHLEPLEDPDTARQDTCPLFGGILLILNGETVLDPQCCGDLSDCWSWFDIQPLDLDKRYLAPGGHPNPYFERSGDELQFTCEDPDDSFTALTRPAFSIPATALFEALEEAKLTAEAFERRLAGLFGDKDFAEALVSQR